jgi:hypothetical protein
MNYSLQQYTKKTITDNILRFETAVAEKLNKYEYFRIDHLCTSTPIKLFTTIDSSSGARIE